MGSDAQMKAKLNLKLAMNRLKLNHKKNEALVAQERRNLADLLEQKKEESARIRAEAVLRMTAENEGCEILELFSELLVTRWMMIEGHRKCPDDLVEAMHTIIYGAPRSDCKELVVASQAFGQMYGKDFYADAASNKHNTVHPRVVEKFAVKVPFPEVITSLLMEVAQQYNIEYTPSSQPMINIPGGAGAVPAPIPSPGVQSNDAPAFPVNPTTIPAPASNNNVCDCRGYDDVQQPPPPPYSAAPPAATQPANELDDLQARFNALMGRQP